MLVLLRIRFQAAGKCAVRDLDHGVAAAAEAPGGAGVQKRDVVALLHVLDMRMAEKRKLRARIFCRACQRSQIAFDTVNMAVGHKDPNVVKLQRQTLRDRRGIVAVAGNVIKIRFLTGKG